MKNFNGKKPNFQPWDERSFRDDTEHLSWLARMCYRTLLQRAWYLSTRPDLPDDADQLRNLLGGIPEDAWTREQAAVRAMFRTDVVNGAPVLWQSRLRKDWTELENYRRQQAENVARRWEKEKGGNGNGKEESKAEKSKAEESKVDGIPPYTIVVPSHLAPSLLPTGICAESAAQADSGALPRDPAGAISLAPDPSLFLTSKASQEDQPPVSEAVRTISTAVYRVAEGRPFPGDIQLLLDKGFTANEIAATFEDYKRNQIDDWAEAHAIQNFFKPDETGLQTGEIACGVHRERAAKEAARVRVPIPR